MRISPFFLIPLLPWFLACPAPKDTGDTGDTGDTADTGDTSDTADTSDTGDTADTGDTGSTGALPPDFVDGLTVQGGCSDFVLYARNVDDSLAVLVEGEQAVAAAYAAGEAVEFSGIFSPAADGAPSLVVRQGQNVTY